MSSRTLDSRLARLRASERFDLRRARSLLWAASFSRSRDRLFCFRAEEVRVASESRRRFSWMITFSRWAGAGLVSLTVRHGILYGSPPHLL